MPDARQQGLRFHRQVVCGVARLVFLAAVATGLAACSSSEPSLDDYEEQSKDPYVTEVCQPAGNNFSYNRPPGPAVLHAVGDAPDQLTDGWAVSTHTAEGINPEVIDDMLLAIGKGDFPSLDSILIARNGKLVLEAYFNGFNRESKHRIYSATKSFASAMVGIAMDKGLITDINQPVSSYFPDYWAKIKNASAFKNELTLLHLLTMTAGVDLDLDRYDVHQRMDIVKYSSDWIKTKLDLPITHPPGSRFDYDSANSFLIGQIVARAAKEPFMTFTRKHLFDPLDISDYCYLENLAGQVPTNNGLILRPRDMLKFGQLYQDRGVWRGQRIISEKWVAQSTSKHLSSAGPGQDKDKVNGYGYHWWTGNKNDDGQHFYFASGHGSQLIMIFPGSDMVIVFIHSEWADLVLNNEHVNQILENYIFRAITKK
jgi:CubicO group peptidase (beta-lactamase class C family)